MKTYFYINFGMQFAWITTSRKNDSTFVSKFTSAVEGVHCTHLVFVASDYKGPTRFPQFDKHKVRDFIKENKLELLGVRLGWTGWQGKIPESDKKALTEAKNKFFKRLFKKYGSSLELAKKHPGYSLCFENEA